MVVPSMGCGRHLHAIAQLNAGFPIAQIAVCPVVRFSPRVHAAASPEIVSWQLAPLYADRGQTTEREDGAAVHADIALSRYLCGT